MGRVTPSSPQRRRRPCAVFHGPVNVCGIGGHLADWQRQRGVRSDFIVYFDFTPQQNHHVNLHFERRWRATRLLMSLGMLLVCLWRYDLFHFYFGCSLLPYNLDLPLLKLFGKKVVMSYCGSDIRLVEVERRWNRYADLLRIRHDHPRFDARKKRMMRWHRMWVDHFTALRNLYESATAVLPPERVTHDVWLGNTVDAVACPTASGCGRTIPLIVHAPTETGIKGTEYVEQAVRELRRRGVRFDYRRVEGIPHAEAARIISEEADIVVDQMLLGAFGTLAVEAMSHGKPVCCYLIEEARGLYFPGCPIVNASIEDLADKLAWLIDHPDERTRLGEEGRAYVEKHCDRQAVNRRVWALYEGLFEATAGSRRQHRPCAADDSRVPAAA